MELLDRITELSHEFGTSDYVRGGGGNTSAKNTSTLWVKPSGTTLAGIEADKFVGLSRKKLAQLYAVQTPEEPAAREKLVREMMEQAVQAETPGRASVEAPLHDSIAYRYVVHTHPALVNGMTCAVDGKKVCARLFPQSLWLDYIDPGYTLCMEVRKHIQAYRDANGHEPYVIFLKNHGVFVAGNTPRQIRNLYDKMLSGLRMLYEKMKISTELRVGPLPESEWLAAARARILDSVQRADVAIAESGMFEFAEGPISPDHIVYSKSYPFVGEPSAEAFTAFQKMHGYLPQVVAYEHAVFGVAATAKKAALALELAQDGAMVKKLAKAFGGVDYMSDRARQFIENWEVESYRSKQI
ncbi:MAG: class II aldolase/adducin family protein [Planctomycetaceae bacterium]|nr:class II aldolase/adducin family protein [Planctomycetaceae bacterium]